VYLLVYWITATFVLMVAPQWTFKFAVRLPFVLLASLILIHSVVQELVVTRLVLDRVAGPAGVLVSALARSLWSAILGPLAAISVFPVGVLLAILYRQRRNVWPMIVAQTIANLVIFALAPR
jgi:membrane protease YdiL (CAAX protease family)